MPVKSIGPVISRARRAAAVKPPMLATSGMMMLPPKKPKAPPMAFPSPDNGDRNSQILKNLLSKLPNDRFSRNGKPNQRTLVDIKDQIRANFLKNKGK